MKVSKGAKIRNRYNKVPHLTQHTNGKVTSSHLDTTNESQEVSPFPAGVHKEHINRRAQRHSKHKTEQKHKRSTKEVPPSKFYYLLLYVLFLLSGFLFLSVHGIGCFIWLWHSPSLPYNYLGTKILIIDKLTASFSWPFEIWGCKYLPPWSLWWNDLKFGLCNLDTCYASKDM